MDYIDYLSTDKCVKIIKEYVEMSGNKITITGGEPILRGFDFFKQILSEVRDTDTELLLYTSGYGISENLLKLFSLYDELKICISIEGDSKIHDLITGINGSYLNVINSLKLFKKYDIKTRINFTPMKINYNYLNHIYSILNEFNINELKIFKFIPQGRGFKNKNILELSPNEEELLTEKILGYKHLYHIDIGGLIKGVNDLCEMNKKIVITDEGNIIPCFGLRYSNYTFGNIYDSSLQSLIANYIKITQNQKCLCHNNFIEIPN
jgi:MoaA/NifB/PqqE/SkfB family radical SAM enzyme